MISKSRYTNSEIITIEFLRRMGAKVTSEAVVEELRQHPDFPNLLAVNDVLNNYGLNTNAYRIPPEHLTEIPSPFIVNTKKRGQEFLIVARVDEKEAELVGNSRKPEVLSLSQFKDAFAGVILVPEDIKIMENKTAAKSNYFHFDQIRNPVILAFAILLLCAGGILIGNDPSPWQFITQLFLKTVGLAVSILLLVQSVDHNNPLVQTLCGVGKTNCNAILSSKAANAFNGLSWSDIGFFYFAGTWLTTLIIGKDISTRQILALLNFASLPYTVYSIYYQARVAKQWCLFCCAIQILLWFEFGSFATIFEFQFKLPTNDNLLIMLICMVIPAIGWLLIKPVLLKSQQVDLIEDQLRIFKYNTDVFKNLLKVKPKYAMPSPDWSIVLGNVEASTIITMVSNPYCPPCSLAHKIIDEWLTKDLDIQVRILFTANNTDEDYKTPVVRHFMALNQLEDKTLVKKALHDWYEQKQKNYDDWAQLYPVKLNNRDFAQLDNQKKWCSTAEIKATPAFLINGHVLPENYRLRDIKYLLAQQ